MIHARIKEIGLMFETSDELFSPENIDKGTLAMLSVVDFKTGDRVLDLGCGYGIVGILAAKIVGAENVVMIDVDERAIELSRANALINSVPGVRIYQSDGFNNVEERDFTLILFNPPYHVDFSLPKRLIEKGFNRLTLGGRMYLVTKRRKWYEKKLISVFGGVKTWEKDDYFVFMSIKKDIMYAKARKQ